VSDQFSLANLFNQPQQNLREFYQQEADRTAQVPAVLDVPVRIVPPPVTIKGDLKFIATFPSDLIYGQKYEAVVQMIMDAFQSAGLEPNPLLPELRIHSLQAWREEVGRPDSDRTPSRAELTDDQQRAIAEWERINGTTFRGSRGDALAAAAAANALAGLHQDGSGGGEEHGADLDERDADYPVDGR
jgi:hypothetical protein